MSLRPPPKPKIGPPIDSIATLPARMNRSAQLMFFPYFCLIGHSSRRALSRLPLSGQLLSGERLEPWREPRKRVVLVREFGKIDQCCHDLLRSCGSGPRWRAGRGAAAAPVEPQAMAQRSRSRASVNYAANSIQESD